MINGRQCRFLRHQDHGKEGNALSQLADRLEQAAQTSQKEKQKVLIDAITEVLRVLESDSEAIVDTVWTTRGDNETLWEHCSHALEQATGIEYKPAEQLPLNLQSQAQQRVFTFDQLTKLLMQAATEEGHKVTMKIKWAQPPAHQTEQWKAVPFSTTPAPAPEGDK